LILKQSVVSEVQHKLVISSHANLLLLNLYKTIFDVIYNLNR